MLGLPSAVYHSSQSVAQEASKKGCKDAFSSGVAAAEILPYGCSLSPPVRSNCVTESCSSRLKPLSERTLCEMDFCVHAQSPDLYV